MKPEINPKPLHLKVEIKLDVEIPIGSKKVDVYRIPNQNVLLFETNTMGSIFKSGKQFKDADGVYDAFIPHIGFINFLDNESPQKIEVENKKAFDYYEIVDPDQLLANTETVDESLPEELNFDGTAWLYKDSTLSEHEYFLAWIEQPSYATPRLLFSLSNSSNL